ncbi:MAG: GNAT family N-acetyltransferase, partial [Pseudomonadota bacterium]
GSDKTRWSSSSIPKYSSIQRVLSDPQSAIIATGGYIAIAEIDGKIVGTGALKTPKQPPVGGLKWLELVKMATDPDAQGQGVGKAVLDHLVEIARDLGAHRIWLETNDRLAPATRLYERTGFRALTAQEERPTPFSRCNLQMMLEL